ncbi:hypothetical protein FV219_00445 [Methylobacterium sp. WL122]|nr:hypothetical protein FV219_00445 [Methylobacterium sp. WL122]
MSDHVYDLGPVISHGLWVVRWIDEIPAESAAEGSPQLRYWFSRIYNLAWREVPFATAIEGPPLPPPSRSNRPTIANIIFATLHVGALTELRLGMVVEDGKPIGRLRTDERKFGFDLPRALPGPRRGLFRANTLAREVWGIDTDMHLMPANGYRFEARRDTFVTVLYDPSGPGRPLIVPSAEVIRAFLAPVSEVARELVRWPPAKIENGIAQPPYQLCEILGPATAAMSDTLWRVDLRESIAARHAPLIANLHPLFSQVGAMAAGEVFSAKQDDLAAKQRTARLAGMIPFTGCTLRFTARVIPLSEHHDLCVEITDVTWPYQDPDRPKIEVVRWKPEPKPDRDRDLVPGERFDTRADWDTQIDPNNDPDHRATVTTFAVDGVRWEALPKPKPVQIAFQPADRIVIDGETHLEDQASTGPTAGGTGLPAGRLSQDPGQADLEPPGVPRFNLVIAMMEALKATGAITDFTLVTPPALVTPTQRGEHLVWSLSRKRAGRRRTLLVCEVALRPGCKILWLEIEPRGQGHISSTALLALGRNLSDAEYRALHTSISKRRSFVELSNGTCVPPGSVFQRWRHGVSDRPLNAVRAEKVMSDLARIL